MEGQSSAHASGPTQPHGTPAVLGQALEPVTSHQALGDSQPSQRLSAHKGKPRPEGAKETPTQQQGEDGRQRPGPGKASQSDSPREAVSP